MRNPVSFQSAATIELIITPMARTRKTTIAMRAVASTLRAGTVGIIRLVLLIQMGMAVMTSAISQAITIFISTGDLEKQRLSLAYARREVCSKARCVWRGLLPKVGGQSSRHFR